MDVVRDETKPALYREIGGILKTAFSVTLHTLTFHFKGVICDNKCFSATRPCFLWYPHLHPQVRNFDIWEELDDPHSTAIVYLLRSTEL